MGLSMDVVKLPHGESRSCDECWKLTPVVVKVWAGDANFPDQVCPTCFTEWTDDARREIEQVTK